MSAGLMVSMRTNRHPTNYGWTSRLPGIMDGTAAAAVAVVLKKNLNAAQPPEQSKGLGWNTGCKVCSPCRHLTRVPLRQTGV